jgi:hypothetical protein
VELSELAFQVFEHGIDTRWKHPVVAGFKLGYLRA